VIETIDLKPDGRNIAVTNDNKKEYIDLVVKWRVHGRVAEQLDAFKKGFFEMIPNELLNIYDESDLSMLFGGLSEIDVDDWKSHTDYRSYTETDQVIKWFWKLVSSWENEQRSRLLQFVTGTQRIPVNGFRDLQGSDGPRRFTIEKAGEVAALPKSHTCFNRLDLPPYETYEILENKVVYASSL
jgi:E3 ubiquitin-protein ligase NEDD4